MHLPTRRKAFRTPPAPAGPLRGWATTLGGTGLWFSQTADTHSGINAAQSPDINDYQYTWMEITVTGPGTLSFWYKVSSEPGYDFLELYDNGTKVFSISGAIAWALRTQAIAAGTHLLRFQYFKDGSASVGSDCAWIDSVTFA